MAGFMPINPDAEDNMIGQETLEVERKISAILKVLSDSPEPLGGRLISQRLKEQGIDLSERAVRYHLQLMDERGLTYCARRRDGRSITEPGLEELKSALVCDKVGFVTARVELLAYLTTFDPDNQDGKVPIDVALFDKEDFDSALDIMGDIFQAGLSISDLVCVASEGERLGDVVVPRDKVGMATVCSVVVNGTLLKAGIPIVPRFGGLLQLRNKEPLRFVDLVEYDGSTLDPSEIFIAGKMTNVMLAVRNGGGKVLASFHEIPAVSKSAAEKILERLEAVHLCGSVAISKSGGTVWEMPVRSDHVGMLLKSGLNPVAAAAEAGLGVTTRTMSGVVDISTLVNFWSL
jgi:repressor of nif and glnA expression